jgi:hypothetical protein
MGNVPFKVMIMDGQILQGYDHLMWEGRSTVPSGAWSNDPIVDIMDLKTQIVITMTNNCELATDI